MNSSMWLPPSTIAARDTARNRVVKAVPPALGERFEVVWPPGAGASGLVVLARDRRLEAEVAVKLLQHSGLVVLCGWLGIPY